MELNREEIIQNVHIWRERIDEASARWGGCEICGVTKTHDAETINASYDAGIRIIGENRVQELLSKIDDLNPAFEIHLIGALQTNKVKNVVGRVQMIQSVDRESLAREIDRRAAEKNITANVLIEVGIAGEAQKSGVPEDGLLALLRLCAELEHVRVRGLMSVMPIADDPEDVRIYFKRMRAWFDRLRDHPVSDRVSMDVLSMGMSNDCIVAAQEGATMVRLGRALYGARAYPANREV